MKALFLLVVLLLCFSLAQDKAKSARTLMTGTNCPQVLVSPDQHAFNLTRAIVIV